jgi:hypothetical protein
MPRWWPAPVALLLAVALVSTPTPVRGSLIGLPHHEVFTGEPYEDVVCGIPVTVVESGQWTNTDLIDNDGNLLFRGTAFLSRTYTAADGDAVVVMDANQLNGSDPLIDEEAGTITFVNTVRGVLEKMKLADGSVLFVDAGYVTGAVTLDLETEEFISFETLSFHGRAPLGDSGFTLWCEAFIEALG